MLVEQIIKQTVDLQDFRVHTVTKDSDGLIAEIRPDTRHRIRCGTCGHPADSATCVMRSGSGDLNMP